MSIEDNKENKEIKEANIKEKEIINNEKNKNGLEEKEEDNKIQETNIFFYKE